MNVKNGYLFDTNITSADQILGTEVLIDRTAVKDLPPPPSW
ncbi:MAG: hypothetical protein U0903_01060 [Planctomycetales bacterium]